MSDPYGDDIEPVSGGGKGKKRSPHARIPGEAPPSSDIDLFLALRAHNDIGNAERLCLRYGDKLRAVQGLGWFGWDELHWSRENGEDLALRCAIATAKSIWAEIAALRSAKSPDEDRIGYLIDHARTSGNIARLNGMLEAATPRCRFWARPPKEVLPAGSPRMCRERVPDCARMCPCRSGPFPST